MTNLAEQKAAALMSARERHEKNISDKMRLRRLREMEVEEQRQLNYSRRRSTLGKKAEHEEQIRQHNKVSCISSRHMYIRVCN